MTTLSSATFSYDAAGNLKNDGRHWYQYDGRNRLTDVFDVVSGVQGYRRAHFEYDGLGRHLSSQYDTDADSSSDLSDENTEWTPRDLLGRPIGIWRQKGASQCSKPYQLFGYHSTGFRGTGYDASGGVLDCPAVRWRDANDDGADGLEEKLYYLQDFRGDVVGLVEPGTGVLEHVRYGPTGRPEAFPLSDVNFDGVVDSQDEADFVAAKKAWGYDKADYDPRADLNRDGDIDGDDESMFYPNYAKFYKHSSNNWKLSQGDGLLGAKTADGLDNRFGWRGYWYDHHLQEYHVRHRVYDPRQGQWLQTDPIGFDAGDQNLYRYADGEYSMGYDPTGLVSGAGETFTVSTEENDCGCGGSEGSGGNDGGGGQSPGQNRPRDVFDQFGVGDDRVNENTRGGHRERVPNLNNWAGTRRRLRTASTTQSLTPPGTS